MNERDMQTMNDQDLVNALREHAEWAEANEWETPITLGDDLAEAADRLENQNAHIAVLQQEIEKLRGQNEQLREAAALVAKESAELLERRWIPVAERLPSCDNQVLVVVSGKPKENITLAGAVELATLYSDGWCLETWPEWTGANVTHWMPLPEPPEAEKALEAMKDE